jgi:tetratricopeptide (TPR) repeat protein
MLMPGIILPDAPGLQNYFNQGIHAYENGLYEEALGHFQRAEERGLHFKLLYNLGNTHYKLENYLQAKVYYLKALKYKPADKQLRHNIRVVNKRFRDLPGPEKEDLLNLMFIRIKSVFYPRDLAFMVLGLVVLLNLFVFFRILGQRKRWILYGLVLSLLLVVLFFSMFIIRTSGIRDSSTAVVRPADAVLRSGPGNQNTVLFNIHSGLTVRIVNRNRDWVYVSAGSRINGWIRDETLIRI